MATFGAEEENNLDGPPSWQQQCHVERSLGHEKTDSFDPIFVKTFSESRRIPSRQGQSRRPHRYMVRTQ
jgi:hypothetical protein